MDGGQSALSLDLRILGFALFLSCGSWHVGMLVFLRPNLGTYDRMYLFHVRRSFQHETRYIVL